jgi:hypothetical protein
MVSIDGKMTRAGLIRTILQNTAGRKSLLLHYEEMAANLDWFGRPAESKDNNQTYISKNDFLLLYDQGKIANILKEGASDVDRASISMVGWTQNTFMGQYIWCVCPKIF